MHLITCSLGESVEVGDCVVKVTLIGEARVQLGITAPLDSIVSRMELLSQRSQDELNANIDLLGATDK